MAGPRFQSLKDEQHYRTLVGNLMAYQSKADRNANKSLDFRDIEKQLQLLGSAVASGSAVAIQGVLDQRMQKIRQDFQEIKRRLGQNGEVPEEFADDLAKQTSKLRKAMGEVFKAFAKEIRKDTVIDEAKRAAKEKEQKAKEDRKERVKELKEQKDLLRKTLSLQYNEVFNRFRKDPSNISLNNLLEDLRTSLIALEKNDVDVFRKLQEKVDAGKYDVDEKLLAQLSKMQEMVSDHMEITKKLRSTIVSAVGNGLMSALDRLGFGKVTVGNMLRGAWAVASGAWSSSKAAWGFAKKAGRHIREGHQIRTAVNTASPTFWEKREYKQEREGLLESLGLNKDEQSQARDRSKEELQEQKRGTKQLEKIANLLAKKNKNKEEGMLSKIGGMLGSVFGALGPIGTAIVAGVAGLAGLAVYMAGGIKELGNLVDKARAFISDTWDQAKEKVKGTAQRVWNWGTGAVDSVRNFFGKAKDRVLDDGSAKGGGPIKPGTSYAENKRMVDDVRQWRAQQPQRPAAPDRPSLFTRAKELAVSAGSAIASTASNAADYVGEKFSSMRSAVGKLFNSSGANLDKVDPAVQSNFIAMAQEYKSQGGPGQITINSAYRSPEEQARLHAADPTKAAPPGRSAHNYGLALDINSREANELDKRGLLSKYGFSRPVPGEPWHIQPAGAAQGFASKGIYSADKPVDQGAPVGSVTPVPQKMVTPQAPASGPNAPATQGRAGAAGGPRGTVGPSKLSVENIPTFAYSDPMFLAFNVGAFAQ